MLSLFFALLLILSPLPARAQDSLTDQLNRAEADYRFQFDQYRQQHTAYTVAKSAFLRSGTIKAEQEALSAVKDTAQARAQVLIAYTTWLRLQLIQFVSVYPRAQDFANRLQDQITWYQDHQAKVQSVTSTADFEAVSAEFTLAADDRDRLYTSAQVELKLATIASLQHQARSLYDPLLKLLETKTDLPEVNQGTARIATLGDEINQGIIQTQEIVGTLESEDFSVTQATRRAVESLETIRAQQLDLLAKMIELETRYGQPTQ